MTFIKKNLIVVATTLALAGAWLWADAGLLMKHLALDMPLIMLIFFCQGMGVDTKELRQVKAYAGLVIWGGIVAHLLAPIFGVGAAWFFGLEGDSRVGFIMMTCMAPTLVSGVVIATQGGGNRTSAVILTVVLNLAAVVIIPLNLQWTLGRGAEIDQWALLRQLLLLILIPAAIGHSVSTWRPQWQARFKKWITYVPVVCLGLLVYMSISQQVGRLDGLTWRVAILLAASALLVHYGLLAIAYVGSRWGLRVAVAHARSAAIVCSQKTIPLAVAVWTLAFKDDYPLAIVPAIIFHLSQIYADGFLAGHWARQDEAARRKQAPR